MMNRWDGIEEAVAVADAGSFVSGARRLEASTSQVSRAVARLERELGVQLFNRTTRVVSLTNTGQLLVDRFRRLISEREEAIAMLELDGEPQGNLRLTCSTTLGERFVAPIVLAYAAEFPRLSVTLDLSNRIVDIAAEGYDLAIRTGTLTDSRLIQTRIASRRILTCAAPEYLERRGIPETVDELGSHECILGSVETWNFLVGGSIQAFKPRGRLRCDNGDVVAKAAIKGMGICHLPEFYLNRAIEEGKLLPILEAFNDRDEPVWAVYPERKHLLPKVELLIRRLRSHLRIALSHDSVGARE